MGHFITFEGVEGCGKTSLIESFASYLTTENYKVITTREPGGTKFGKELRRILQHEDYNISPLTQTYLVLADRQHHIEEIIRPFLNIGYVVLCDRYIDSTLAYQGFGSELIYDESLEFSYICATENFIMPDLTIILDVDPDIGLKRKRDEDNDNFHKLDIDYHNRVRNGYLKMASIFDEFSNEDDTSVKIIDASKDIMEVYKDMIKIWKEFISE